MNEEIVNRVANSKLVTIDLEEFYPEGNRISLDMKQWLFEGLILKEKDFRQKLKEHDWEQYQDAYVAIQCSSDAILPSWATLLVTTCLQPYAKFITSGNLNELESLIFSEVIQNINLVTYTDKPVIIKGCSEKNIPESAFVLLTQKVQKVAKSVMFGAFVMKLLKKSYD